MSQPRKALRSFLLAFGVAAAGTVASASFGGTPCGADFSCHFQVWGLLLGVVGGIPISSFIFMCLHLGFRNPARSRDRQFWLGGFFGIVAYEIAAACAALVGTWGKDPMAGLAPAYAVLAIASVLYVRSSPRANDAGGQA